MKKNTIIVAALIVALAVSVGFNAYQASQTINPNSEQATRVEMNSKLTQAQVQVNAALQALGNSAVYASKQLSTTGLSGSQARDVLGSIVQNKSYIIDASAVNLEGVFVTVEPAAFHNLEGSTMDMAFDVFAPSTNPIYPVMQGVYSLIEGGNGSVVMTPIFNANGAMVGAVSIAFDQSALIGEIAAEVCAGTPFVIWGSDTKGKMIYEVNKAEEGTNLFTDPDISTWETLQVFAKRMVAETAGYGTYEYFNYEGTGRTVVKQAYWCTVGAYGVEWRLILTNVLPS